MATYATSSLNAGSHIIKAIFVGDATFKTSTRSLTELVKLNLSATALISDLHPSNYGQSVTFTATVSSTHGPVPDGELVTFFDGTTTLASVSSTSGVASYTTSSLSVANHVIKAIYAGDTTFATSTKSFVQVVRADPTTTVLGSSLNPSHSGQSVTLTATVSSTYGSIPDGEMVTFFDGSTTLASVLWLAACKPQYLIAERGESRHQGNLRRGHNLCQQHEIASAGRETVDLSSCQNGNRVCSGPRDRRTDKQEAKSGIRRPKTVRELRQARVD